MVSPILLQYMMLKSHQQPNRQGDLVLCNSSGTESRAHAGKAKHRKIHSCEKCTLAPKYFNHHLEKIQVTTFYFLNVSLLLYKFDCRVFINRTYLTEINSSIFLC